MIGYEDYNALGLPPEYYVQDRFEQMEQKVIDKLDAAGLGILFAHFYGSSVWIDAIDEMVEAEQKNSL